MDSFTFEETILPWQYRTCYIQPFQTTDSLRQQCVSEVGPIITRLYNSDGIIVEEIPWQPILQDRFNPGRYIYESVYALSNLLEGFYNPVLVVNDVEVMQSACWVHLKAKHPLTILAELSNSRKKYGFHFQASGLVPYIREYGALLPDKKSSVDVIYTDEEENSELLNSITYRITKLFLGGPSGLPHFKADQWADMLSCDSLKLEGRYYTKATEGSEFEMKESEVGREYPKVGLSISLRNAKNSHGIVSINNVQQVAKAAFVYHSEDKGFSPAGQSGMIGTIIREE